MSFWKLVQQNSELLLSEGLRALLSSEAITEPDSVPEKAGVYAFIGQAGTVLLGETDDLKKSIRPFLDSDTSKLRLSFPDEVRDDGDVLSRFRLYAQPTAFGRRELLEYAETCVPKIIRTTELTPQGRYRLPGSCATWKQLQHVSSELVAEGGRDTLSVKTHRWGGPAAASGPGLLLISAPDGEVIYIGESVDIGQSYRDHMRNTTASEFRRHIAEHILGLKPKTKKGKGPAFSADEERMISEFVRSCSVSFCTASVGRYEVRADLIQRLRPMLNIQSDKGPYARTTRPFEAPSRRSLFG